MKIIIIIIFYRASVMLRIFYYEFENINKITCLITLNRLC